MMRPSTSSRAVVLIVEDEPLVRMMVIELFQDEGFEVLEAANADQALGIFGERDDVALLFTDVEMPGSIDGYALARWVSGERGAVEKFCQAQRTAMADDVDGDPVFLASSTFSLRRVTEANEGLTFRDIKDIRAVVAA